MAKATGSELKIWLSVAFIAAIGAGAWVMRDSISQRVSGTGSKASTVGAPPARAVQPVESAVAESGTVADEVEAIGTLTANESAAIAPEIAGRITSLDFKEGQPVKAGQTLVQLDSSILDDELRQAESELTLAESTFERTNELVKRGAGTVVAQQTAISQRIAAQVKLEVAKTRLEKSKLQAPFDGIAGLRSISAGNYVNAGQPIVTVTSVDPIKVDFRVSEIFLRNIKEGQKITARADARPGMQFDGEIYAIDPVVDENGRAIRLRARIANKDGSLAPGLFARVTITTGARENATLIPETAIVPQASGAAVYVIENSVARLRMVKLGKRLPGKVEIIDGVKPGETVVTAGQMRLREGVQVAVKARQAEN